MKFLKKYSILLALALMLQAAPLIVAADATPAVWYAPSREAVVALTQTPFYQVQEGSLAAGLGQLPEDVTAEYQGNDLYDIGAVESRGRAFRIKLNEKTFWADGSTVTAADVANRLREQLSERTWIAGAEAYLTGAEKPAEAVISLKDAGFATATAAKEAGYTRFYMDLAHFWGLEAGWEPIDSTLRFRDYAMPGGLDETFVTPAYLYRNYLAEGAMLSYMHSRYVGIAQTLESVTLEDVGILENGEYELTIITAEAMTARTLASRLASLTLEGDYGPYRLVSADADEMILARNEYWQGDASQYPAYEIRCILQ